MTKGIVAAFILSGILVAGCSNRAASPPSSSGTAANAKSPQAAAAPAAAQGTQAPSATKKIVYTCPMHPEVQQATAGKCPKCGMTLMAKEID